MFKSLDSLWDDNKWFFLVGCLLLTGSAFIGYHFPEQIKTLATQMLAQIKEIANSLKGNDSPLVTFFTIFSRNILSSVMMMVLGLFFGLFPIYGLVANGILLGYMLAMMSGNVSPLQLFVVGILPHGIIELPAVIFAASLGIRYGALVFRSLIDIWQAERRAKLKTRWQIALRQFSQAVSVVAVLLIIAALIESTITPLLIEMFIKPL